MSPSTGISIHHTRAVPTSVAEVRGDILGIIGIVTKARWPRGLTVGDYIDTRVDSWTAFQAKPAKSLFDGATQAAIRLFFENGGVECHVFGLCVEGPEDLQKIDVGAGVYDALMYKLNGVDDIGLLTMPVLSYLPINQDKGIVTSPGETVWRMLLAHCRTINFRFLVIDAPRGLHEQSLLDWAENFTKSLGNDGAFGAVYYPWLKNGEALLAPSGAILGLMAKLEWERQPFGVWWPPANRELMGVTHTDFDLRWDEVDGLSEVGINPIMHQASRGVVVWGASTMSRDPKWKHINARRIVSMVAEQIRRDTEWAVFENQNSQLWDGIATRVRIRLNQMWERGLLTGDRPGDDYSVQCDGEVNTKLERSKGLVNVKVTMRPITTTEQIVIELELGSGSVFEREVR